MSADPLLVLQLQRMGDLILTFPLLLALKKRWPGHPIWVAAEPRFFQELMPLAPEVVFFPPSHCPTLARGHYAAAVNLSARPEAAACLAGLEAGLKLGPAALPDGLHVHGFWQLYRTALTQNNHHNAFHWSDLYRLDLEPAVRPGQTGHILPKGAGSGRVALVLGASEAAKRPDALFWARLARRLAGAGAMPVFLGGPAESALGQEVARLAQLPHANLCGRLPLRGRGRRPARPGPLHHPGYWPHAPGRLARRARAQPFHGSCACPRNRSHRPRPMGFARGHELCGLLAMPPLETLL